MMVIIINIISIIFIVLFWGFVFVSCILPTIVLSPGHAHLSLYCVRISGTSRNSGTDLLTAFVDESVSQSS